MRGPRVRAVYRGLVGELERYVVMALLATDLALAEAPGNVLPGKKESGLSRDSVIVVPQVGAIDRRRLVEGIARLRKGIITKVESGIRLVPGLGNRGSPPSNSPRRQGAKAHRRPQRGHRPPTLHQAPMRESASPPSKRSPPSNSSSRRQCAIAHRRPQRGHRPPTLHQGANARSASPPSKRSPPSNSSSRRQCAKAHRHLQRGHRPQTLHQCANARSASPPSKRPPPPDSSSMRQCAQRIAAFDEAIALTPATRGPTPDKTRPHRQTRYLPRTSPVAPRKAANER